MPWKTVPTWEGLVRSFTVIVVGQVADKDQGVCKACFPFLIWLGDLLVSLSDFFNPTASCLLIFSEDDFKWLASSICCGF